MSLPNGGVLLTQRHRSAPAEPTTPASARPAEHHETAISRMQSQRRKSRRPIGRSSECSECKANHHMCDAQSPVCSRCIRLGRTCAYGTSSVDRCSAGDLREHSGADSLSRCRQAEISPFTSLSKVSTTSVHSKYGIYFDHFRYHVASQLGGSAFGNFWQQCVLRESARDQCILDAILALGSLDRARKCDPRAAATPLFVALPSSAGSLRRTSQVDHYPQAVSLYAKALNDYRCRVTVEAVPPRTTLIMTLLLVAFEHLHGNMDAVDRLTSRTLALLKKKVGALVSDPSSSDHAAGAKHELAPFVATDLDDDGVRVAADLLERMVSLNALYTSLYPRCNAMIKDSLDIPKSRQTMPTMQPLDAHSSILEIEKAWTSFLTMIGAWIQDANRAAIRCYIEKSPDDEDMLVEQSHYKHQLESLMSLIQDRWRNASKAPHGIDHHQQLRSCQEDERPDSEMDITHRLVLERTQIAVMTANVSVSAALDATAQTWDSFNSDLHDVLDRISGALDASTPEARESGVLYDDMLGVAAHVAIESRDWEVRRKAMARWARMLSPRSSWENKTCFMGATALILVEEAGRLSADQSERKGNGVDRRDPTRSDASEEADKRGIIPVEAQYSWTRGVWDKDFAQYTVTLTPKLETGLQDGTALPASTPGETTVVLDLQDFPFGRSCSGGLDAVERLQQYLSR